MKVTMLDGREVHGHVRSLMTGYRAKEITLDKEDVRYFASLANAGALETLCAELLQLNARCEPFRGSTEARNRPHPADVVTTREL